MPLSPNLPGALIILRAECLCSLLRDQNLAQVDVAGMYIYIDDIYIYILCVIYIYTHREREIRYSSLYHTLSPHDLPDMRRDLKKHNAHVVRLPRKACQMDTRLFGQQLNGSFFSCLVFWDVFGRC